MGDCFGLSFLKYFFWGGFLGFVLLNIGDVGAFHSLSIRRLENEQILAMLGEQGHPSTLLVVDSCLIVVSIYLY